MMGGMSKKDRELFGDKETDAPEPDNFKKSKKAKEAEDKNKKLDRLIEQKTKIDRVKYGKKKGGKIKMKKGGMVKKHRGDGCAQRGKTKGRMV
jgi:hypothetical protein